MELVMYLGLDMIDAVRLDADKITEPGYLGSLKRELVQRHTTQLEMLSVEPEFLIVRAAQ